jgi:murein DD-endopeptidase MepM/ murein hydrolase activator NlpD
MPPICIPMSHSTHCQGSEAPATRQAVPVTRRARLAGSRLAAIRLVGQIVLLGLLCLALARPAEASPAPAEGGDQPDAGALLKDQPLPAVAVVTAVARTESIEYQVQDGDTLYDIAAKNGIGVQTLIWANNLESHPASLRIGQSLTIPPVDGVTHVIQAGDTLLGIASRYKVDLDTIRSFPGNHLDGDSLLQPGQKLIVPGGLKPSPPPKVVAPKPTPAPAAQAAAPAAPVAAPAPAPAQADAAPEPAQAAAAPAPAQAAAAAPSAPAAPAPDGAPLVTGHFVWPISGTVSQGNRPYHHALDILGKLGMAIKASDGGRVVYAGWTDDGYGYHVVIDHGNGYRTLYGHMSRIDVQVGQSVPQNDIIGAVGATGRATAFHVHFEIEQNGVRINPAPLLP